MKTIFALAVFVATLFGCPSTPNPPVPCTETVGSGSCPDASPAPPAEAAPAPADVSPAPTPDPTGCGAACANLAKLGCPEGLAANCAPACSAGSQITDLKPACLAAAANVAAVQACGTVKCVVAAKK